MPVLPALVLIAAFSGAPEATPIACSDDPFADCMKEFGNAARKTFGQTNEGQRAQTAGEAVRRCLDCAGQTFERKMNEFGGSNNKGNARR